ncbi:hypothetical protein NX059_001393 [Plenodomus lindquistii]|nr:hypothetical protein NX059_001393 [Plenodomus lindquistii]
MAIVLLLVEQGADEAAQLLIEAGADVKASAHCNPLHMATQGGSTATIVLLLDRGPEVNARDQIGWTALSEASRNLVEIVELLIARGADVTLTDVNGETALHHAAASDYSHDRKRTLELLIQNGADINAKDNHGDRPLYSKKVKQNMQFGIREEKTALRKTYHPKSQYQVM